MQEDTKQVQQEGGDKDREVDSEGTGEEEVFEVL